MSRKKKRALRVVVVTVSLALIAAVLGGGWWALDRLGITGVKPAQADTPADALLSPVSGIVTVPALPYTVEQDGVTYGFTEIGGRPVSIQLHTRDGVTYLALDGHEMILVNKQYTVPRDYGNGVTAEAQAAFDAFMAAAGSASHSLSLESGFRSYDQQASLHDYYLSIWSYDYVKSVSAEPGHSEHQLGLAFDVSDEPGRLYRGFGETDAGKWLAQHAAEYGFIVRYPQDKTWATGYAYEPWHFRYVGVELAQLIAQSGLTVEELIGQPHQPAPTS